MSILTESQSGAVMANESTDKVKTAILSRSKDRAGSNQNQETTKEAEPAKKEARTHRAR